MPLAANDNGRSLILRTVIHALMHLDLEVPDHMTLSRRGQQLDVGGTQDSVIGSLGHRLSDA